MGRKAYQKGRGGLVAGRHSTVAIVLPARACMVQAVLRRWACTQNLKFTPTAGPLKLSFCTSLSDDCS